MNNKETAPCGNNWNDWKHYVGRGDHHTQYGIYYRNCLGACCSDAKRVDPASGHEPSYILTEKWELPQGLHSVISTTCNHNWSVYEGLVERFEYCTNCDEKRV